MNRNDVTEKIIATKVSQGLAWSAVAGKGIMSAIDFSMDITREADPKGDRVKVVLSGKFLPYRAC